MGLFPYIGGDQRLVNKLVPLLPKTNTFLEAFGGSGSLSLKLAELKAYPSIIWNDLDPLIYDAFKLIKHHPQAIPIIHKVLVKLTKALNNRKPLKKYIKQIRDGLNSGEIKWPLSGLWTIILHHICHVPFRSGIMLRWVDNPRRYNYVEKHLKEKHSLLQRIALMNGDAFKLLDDYNEKDVVIYVDPPHLTPYEYYRLSFTWEDARVLDEHLRSLEAKVLLKLSPEDRPHYSVANLWREISIPYTKYNSHQKSGKYYFYTNYDKKGLESFI